VPIDQAGADRLFQVISLRYEQGAIVLTAHRAFKAWPTIFHNDRTLTAAILDRVLHHAETVIIAGKSVRMKDQRESSSSGHLARRRSIGASGGPQPHSCILHFQIAHFPTFSRNR
jgi:hypothetical protein